MAQFKYIYIYNIRRPLPSLGLGGAAPGITVGVRHDPVPGFGFEASEPFQVPLAAFEGLKTSQPSAAAFEGVPLALPWYLPRPHGPTSCFYWASKLLRGTFWAGLITLKTSAAAFEGLSTSQPQQLSKASHLLCHGTSLGPTS